MKWNKLISDKRYGYRRRTNKTERSNFEKDYDRIIFSTGFRNLQDKTQVIPLPENSFVHNRLTHSLETASVGRTLGKIVGESIIEQYNLNCTASDFGVIVASACLAHDIGNPPFGHSGESSMNHYFKEGKGRQFKDQINDPNKWADLINFEGNANGFKLLTNSFSCVEGGINLSYATLATFTKYPRPSLIEPLSVKRTSQKKYGYFNSEQKIFNEIFTDMGITSVEKDCYLRHPLAFLVEAADDICYRIIDFEDGIRIGWIDRELGLAMLKKVAGRKYNENRFNEIIDPNEQLSYMRSIVINNLISDVSKIFLANEEAIRSGEYDKPLIDDLSYTKSLNEIVIKSINEIYNHESVVKIEISGFQIVSTLLEAFISSVNNWDKTQSLKVLKKEYPLSYKLIHLMPLAFRVEQTPPSELYDRIMMVNEFISGLTDKHALNIHNIIKGLNI